MEKILNQLVVDIWPEVIFSNKPYSYLIDPGIKNFELLAPGAVVKIPLHGRTLKGWVDRVRSLTEFSCTDDSHDVAKLKNVISCVSIGPKKSVLNLVVELKDIYFTSPGVFLKLASYKKNIRKHDYYTDVVPVKSELPVRDQLGDTQLAIIGYLNELSQSLKSHAPKTNKDGTYTDNVVTVRHPPNSDFNWLISHLCSVDGAIVVLTPTLNMAEEVLNKLRLNRVDAEYESRFEPKLRSHMVYVGNRNSVFTSKPTRIKAMIILDCENGLYTDERAPCFNAVEVAKVRSKIENFFVVLCSTNPPVKTLYSGKALENVLEDEIDIKKIQSNKIFSYPKSYEFNSWPYVEIFKKFEDKNRGLMNERIVEQIESAILKNSRKVIVIYQQKGYINSLKCMACDAVAVCENCNSALKAKRLDSRTLLYCQFCDTLFVRMCKNCGSFDLKVTRKGFMAVADELRLVLDDRIKITTEMEEFNSGNCDLLINTTAALNRKYKFRVGLAVLLDFDQFLLNPSIDSANDGLSVVANCANLLGKKTVKPSPLLLIQTGVTDHYLFNYLRDLDYKIYCEHELRKRKLFGYPPFATLAYLSSRDKKVLSDFINNIDNSKLEILGPTASDEYVLKGDIEDLNRYLNLDNRSSKIKVKLDLSL